MNRIEISEDALQDLNDGFTFYEAQENGLGEYFVSSLRSDIEGLKISAGMHPLIYKDYHRLLSRVFPLGIFYTCAGNLAEIWAVVDLRRDPDWIKRHLDA